MRRTVSCSGCGGVGRTAQLGGMTARILCSRIKEGQIRWFVCKQDVQMTSGDGSRRA